MKVIFLDNDGVICLASEWGSRYKKGMMFDHLNTKAVKILNEIIEATGAEIVISSDWKLHTDLQELCVMYLKEGLCKIPIAVTPRYQPQKISGTLALEFNRIQEINQYLSMHPEVTNWVAIDDLEMFDLGEDHFVHCPRSNEGIKQSGLKQKIINILNRNIDELPTTSKE